MRGRHAPPKKVRVTKEMVIDAAFEVTRAEGIEAVNAKNVAGYLKCSTQMSGG